MSQKYEIDMTHGPLLGKLLVFALPLILSSILQLLFNAADIIVVGQFSGSDALAAVGSTGALINLLVNLFLGLSVGVNVLYAQYIGAGNIKDASETLHTSVYVSLICGVILTVVGYFLARPLLLMMGSPENVVGLSTLYLKIYFLGMPAMLFYNFGSAVLRAVGDTRRPLIFLTVSGIINVFLNLFFVIVLHHSVDGVAAATVISEIISALLLLRCLMHMDGPCRLKRSEMKITTDKLVKIIHIGLPAGLQGVIFSLSNVIIQSSVNSFGSTVMAGNAAAGNIEGFVYVSMNAFHQTCVSFTSQNYGAHRMKRIPHILILCELCVITTGLVLGNLAYFCGPSLLRIYNSDPEVIRYGLIRMRWICIPYFTCGVMDVFVGSIRGLGYSVTPMIVSLIGACLFRIVWILTYFQSHHTLGALYASYPISWVLTLSAHFICYLIIYNKVCRQSASAS
jgi:putative MATE family efflux protein